MMTVTIGAALAGHMACRFQWGARPTIHDSSRMAIEQELKLRFDPADADALRRHPALSTLAGAPPTRTTLLSWYFDTAEHGLRKRGLALRVRHLAGGRRVLAVKSSPADGLQLARGEWELDIRGDHPSAADLAQLQHTPLAAIAAPRELAAALRPVCATRFERTAWEVRWKGATLEVALDVGVAIGGAAPDAPSEPIHELEIECLEGPFSAAFDLAWILAQDVALRPSPVSKAMLAAIAAGWIRPALPTVARSLRAAPRAGTSVSAALHRAVAMLSVGAELMQRDPQAEAVHQLRLQLRRLRSLLQLLEHNGAAVRAGCRWLDDEWRWAGQLLGAVRDVDVCREQIHALDDSQNLDALLDARRAERLSALQAYLRSPRFGRALLAQARWAQGWEDGAWSAAREKSSTWARALLQHLLRDIGDNPRVWRTLLREWDTAAEKPANAPWTRLHRARLRTKRLRYVLEWLSPWAEDTLGPRAAQWLSLSHVLQTDLGTALDVKRLADWAAAGAADSESAAQAERGVLLAFEQARRALVLANTALDHNS